jgi:hypothetical protein
LVLGPDIQIIALLTSWNITIALNIDGEQVDYYHVDPPTGDGKIKYTYNVAMLQKFGLSDTTHTARVDLVPPSQFIVRIIVLYGKFSQAHKT